MKTPTLNPETEKLVEKILSMALDASVEGMYGYKAVDFKKKLATELAKVEQRARDEERLASWYMTRRRCLLFGCVFGIPMVDKEPKKECMFCHEPGYIDQDQWLNESPMENMQKTINRLTEKYKTPEAIDEYLESLTPPTTNERKK